MALTGRAALAALAGALVVLAVRTVRGAAGGQRVLLAAHRGRPDAGGQRARGCGSPGPATPGCCSARRRRSRSRCATPAAGRCAPRSGPPGSRARARGPARSALRVPARRPGQRDHHAHPGPPRGQGVRRGDGPLVRAAAGWPPGRAATRCRGRSGCCRRSAAGGTWPEKLARLRQLEGQHRSLLRGPGTRVRLAARVRGRRRRPVHRLAGGGPARRRDGAHLAAGAGPAHPGRAGHRPDLGRPGRRASRGWTPPWTRRCCSPRSPSRAGDRVDLLAFDRRLRARVHRSAPRTSVLASVTGAMAPLDAELTETDAAALASAVLDRGPAPLPGGAAHRPEPGGDRGGPAAPAAARWRPGTG